MRATRQLLSSAALMAVSFWLSACSNGGNLTLEPGAVKLSPQGSPYIQVNQGGKSLVVGSNGVHGWLSVQTVSSQNLSSSSGSTAPKAVINRAAAVH